MQFGWWLRDCCRSASVPATTPSLDLVAALEATSPNPSLGDQAQVPGRLVGTWDVEYTDFAKDGKAIHRTGEFIVGWVMDGRAIQDLWIVNPSGKRSDREVYTTLHYFDPKSRTWHATFVDPEHSSIARLHGRAAGKRSVRTRNAGPRQRDATDGRSTISARIPSSTAMNQPAMAARPGSCTRNIR
jgi:hypothetical protein